MVAQWRERTRAVPAQDTGTLFHPIAHFSASVPAVLGQKWARRTLVEPRAAHSTSGSALPSAGASDLPAAKPTVSPAAGLAGRIRIKAHGSKPGPASLSVTPTVAEPPSARPNQHSGPTRVAEQPLPLGDTIPNSANGAVNAPERQQSVVELHVVQAAANLLRFDNSQQHRRKILCTSRSRVLTYNLGL